MTRIGFLGAYSIANIGDQLVGYATRQAVRRLLPQSEAQIFAPALPHAFWRHELGRDRGIDGEIIQVPTQGPLTWAKDLAALIIGGGGILNLDPSFRPFLLGEPESWNSVGVPAAWNGICSQNEPSYLPEFAAAYQAVRSCCERLSYVSVRNRTTERFLRSCGYGGTILVVPDPVMLLEDSEPAPREAGKFTIGLSVGGAIQDGRAIPFFTSLFGALRRLLERSDVATELLIFPFGQVYGDDRFAQAAAEQLPGARRISQRLPPLSAWRLIGKLNLFIGTRLHAVLAAFCQDVPFLAIDEYFSDAMASSKLREFMVDAGLESQYLCPYLPVHPYLSPARKLDALCAALPGVSYRATREAYQAQLRAHYVAMLTALGLLHK